MATGDDSDQRTSDPGHPLESLADEAVEAIEGDQLTLGDLLETFGTRGFGPLITIFALFAAIPPIGGIPGVPTVMGILIFLISIQLAFQRKYPWFPDWLKDRGIDRDKVEKAEKKSEAIFEKIDKLIGPRLQWATENSGQTMAALACLILAGMMPPLEVVPFAVMLPAIVVAIFGLAITARDGLLMLIGGAGFAAALYVGFRYLPI